MSKSTVSNRQCQSNTCLISVKRQKTVQKTFLKYWQVGSIGDYIYRCEACFDPGCLIDCHNELTFYEWLLKQKKILIHLPKIFDINRNAAQLPLATYYYNADTGNFVNNRSNANSAKFVNNRPNANSAQYAYVLMEYLDGTTLRELYKRSSNCYEAAKHARSCFQQLFPVFNELNKFGFKYIDFNTGQFMKVNNTWYLIDMNVDFDEAVKLSPQFTDWKQLVRVYMNFANSMVARRYWTSNTANSFSKGLTDPCNMFTKT